MKIKSRRGFSIMELMVALITLMVALSLGSGVFMSSYKISGDSIDFTEAGRNAQTAVMHLEKNLCNAASNYAISAGPVVRYRAYSAATSAVLNNPPDIISEYAYDSANKQLRYCGDTLGTPPVFVIAATHISFCGFSTDALDSTAFLGEIRALDNSDTAGSEYTISMQVRAKYTASPPVYEL